MTAGMLHTFSLGTLLAPADHQHHCTQIYHQYHWTRSTTSTTGPRSTTSTTAPRSNLSTGEQCLGWDRPPICCNTSRFCVRRAGHVTCILRRNLHFSPTLCWHMYTFIALGKMLTQRMYANVYGQKLNF